MMRNDKSNILNIISWIFGVVVIVIGLVNTFWGNDSLLGIFLQILSFFYFPPAIAVFKEWTGFSIPRAIKIGLGIFILWISLGVAELFDKIRLMMMDL